jgi:hypothetical protein
MTPAHDAPPILSRAQEADAEAAYERWRDNRDPFPWSWPLGVAAYSAWMAAWRACRRATLLEVERQRREAAKRAKGRANGGQP